MVPAALSTSPLPEDLEGARMALQIIALELVDPELEARWTTRCAAREAEI